jgi:hypothetical protein
MSGRGGTTGRAAGCPASVGRGCGRRGVPGAAAEGGGGAVKEDGGGAAARLGGFAGKAGVGGGMGAADPTAGGGGKGWRGPDKIWPGRGGGGTGRAGIGPDRKGGCTGAPAARGGRKGAGLERESSSAAAAGIWLSPGCTGAGSGIWGAGLLATIVGGSSKTGDGAGSSSSSATATADVLVADSAARSPPWTRRRISSATGSSTELECVFFSVTPSSGSMSRMLCDGISSCLANSLIRILPITTANAV